MQQRMICLVLMVIQCLSDIVESYLGALFVDSQFNYAEVQRFFDVHIKRFFEDMSTYGRYASDHPVASNSQGPQ